MGFMGKQNVLFVHLELTRIALVIADVPTALLELLLSYLDHPIVNIVIMVCIAASCIMCNFVWQDTTLVQGKQIVPHVLPEVLVIIIQPLRTATSAQ